MKSLKSTVIRYYTELELTALESLAFVACTHRSIVCILYVESVANLRLKQGWVHYGPFGNLAGPLALMNRTFSYVYLSILLETQSIYLLIKYSLNILASVAYPQSCL